MATDPRTGPTPGTSRRRLLAAGAFGATAIGGAAVGGTTGYMLGREPVAQTAAPPRRDLDGVNGTETEPFHGLHQAGVETPAQAHAAFVSLSLRSGVRAAEAVRWLRLLTDDAAALTQGTAPLADSEPELAVRPARLTVTVGFGRGLVALAGRARMPEWLRPLEAFRIDQFDPALCRGDLLLQVCGDDPLTVSHARRMLLKDSRSFAELAWQRTAFRRSPGSVRQGNTQRNLFGQLDGTANPGGGSEDFARLVWGSAEAGADASAGTGATASDPAAVFSARGEPPADLGSGMPAWMRGGTTLVLRDIAMNLDTWDEADRPAREFSIGRRLDTGAPLTGRSEFDEPDFEARDARGLTVISAASHVARARQGLASEVQIHRRTFNYETSGGAGSASAGGAGLMFASFQADIDRQFLPIQRRLAEVDLLNTWTTPIGSTVWAIPPGVEASARTGAYLGQPLFEG